MIDTKTDIEKTWYINHNGYSFIITRNRRKDVFLSEYIKDTFNDNFIVVKETYFLTLKRAKKHALQIIKEYEGNFNLNN